MVEVSRTGGPQGSAWLRQLPTWQRFVAAFVALLLILFAGVARELGRFGQPLFEVTLAGLLLSAFATHPVVARTRAAAGLSARRLALAWPALVLFVDLLHVQNQFLYPFVQWSMFAGTAGHLPNPVQIRLLARYPDGSSARVFPGVAVSDVVASHLDGRLRTLWTKAATEPELAKQAVEAVRGAARMQELADPEHPISEVAVDHCTMAVKPPYVPSCSRLGVVSGPFR